VLFYGVVSASTEEAVELFTSREEAEAVVQAWERRAWAGGRATGRADRVSDGRYELAVSGWLTAVDNGQRSPRKLLSRLAVGRHG
jgi:hypothetical protein